MKIYLSGAITGEADYEKKFAEAELYCKTHKTFTTIDGEEVVADDDVVVLNPCVLPLGLDWNEYMVIDLAMLSVCDYVMTLNGWEKSKGACMEVETARQSKKKILKTQKIF